MLQMQPNPYEDETDPRFDMVDEMTYTSFDLAKDIVAMIQHLDDSTTHIGGYAVPTYDDLRTKILNHLRQIDYVK